MRTCVCAFTINRWDASQARRSHPRIRRSYALYPAGACDRLRLHLTLHQDDSNVRELRVLATSRSQRQGDAAIDNYGAQQQTALTDFVVRHPTAATSNYRYGQSGDTAKDAESYKEGKYGAAAEGVGLLFIPFAMETYGKMGKKALRMLRTMQQDQADSNPTSALRP